jgi:GWxTD domain-containing protein
MTPDQPADLPVFHLDALCFAADKAGQTRVDVFIQTPYENLRFTDVDQKFTSTYDVTVDFLDSTNTQVMDKSWVESVEARDYDESVSPRESNIAQRSFALQPGNYTLDVQVRDEETKKSYRQKRRLWVRDFSTSPFAMSDLMLVNRLAYEGEKRILSPNISGNIAEANDSFHIFFEVYDRLKSDSVHVKLRILDERDIPAARDSFAEKMVGERLSVTRRVNVNRMIAGEYRMEIDVSPSAGFGEVAAHASRPVRIEWRGIPVAEADLDKAIDQLQYIVDREKLDSMKKAPAEKKREMFKAFWKQRDPTPNTERNELMEEYYGRVAYANKHFTHYMEGWRSDMGMVYIIFGPPNNIERHPFDIDAKPYEVWTYYDINREFVFVDASGFGDYKLTTPLYDIYGGGRPR